MNLTHKTLASILGVTINYDGDPGTLCNWDGKQVNAKGQTEDILYHELCHWMVAEPERRSVPDYGLGAGPSTSWKAYQTALAQMGKTPGDFHHVRDVDEEILVCTLEFCFEAIDGHDMTALMVDRNFLTEWSRTGKHPGKYVWESDDLRIHIKALQERGLIDHHWIPKVIKHLVTKDHRAHLTAFRKLVRLVPKE